MGKVHVVTLQRLNRALAAVVPELDRHGFWSDRVEAIEVRLATIGAAYGWKWSGPGHITIPALSTAKLRDWYRGSYTSLADVLRHEYGHAVADTHRALVRSSRFRGAFDAAHDSDQEFEVDADVHFTEYGASSPAEDFAETFMVYLRHQGKLPPHHDTPAKRARWRFVGSLGRAVRAGRRRW